MRYYSTLCLPILPLNFGHVAGDGFIPFLLVLLERILLRSGLDKVAKSLHLCGLQYHFVFFQLSLLLMGFYQIPRHLSQFRPWYCRLLTGGFVASFQCALKVFLCLLPRLIQNSSSSLGIFLRYGVCHSNSHIGHGCPIKVALHRSGSSILRQLTPFLVEVLPYQVQNSSWI